MLNANKVIIAGCLTREPDCRSTPNGSLICELGVAVNRRGKDGNDEVAFIDVTVWGKTAEACRQYLAKGSNVYIEGRLVYEKWEDRNGANRYKLKVVAENVQFISRPESSGQQPQNRQAARSNQNESGRGGRYSEEDCPSSNNGGSDDVPF